MLTKVGTSLIYIPALLNYHLSSGYIEGQLGRLYS
jgi:hypothetical protein